MITKIEMKSSPHFSNSFNSKQIHKDKAQPKNVKKFGDILKEQLSKHNNTKNNDFIKKRRGFNEYKLLFSGQRRI